MEGQDKLLLPLEEQPVLLHTLRALELCPYLAEIIVVTREDLIVPVSQLCRDFMLDKVTKVMVGGAERVLSVRIGVQEARRDAAAAEPGGAGGSAEKGCGYRGGGAGHSHGGYHQAGRAGRCGGDDGPLQPVGGPDAPGL